jgi:hypothetical protein
MRTLASVPTDRDHLLLFFVGVAADEVLAETVQSNATSATARGGLVKIAWLQPSHLSRAEVAARYLHMLS